MEIALPVAGASTGLLEGSDPLLRIYNYRTCSVLAPEHV